ncbi:MAG: hypothetical protein DSY37_02060 [Hyperthermus sp.]|nr:MAG: hypothetical protein DSY37_02060 [Hyperthermus sp.]
MRDEEAAALLHHINVFGLGWVGRGRMVSSGGLLARRRLILLVAAGLALMVLVVIPVYVAYASLHPPRCISTLPEALASKGVVEFNVTSPDGVVVKGFIVNPNGVGSLVFVLMHGYTSCSTAPYIVKLAGELSSRGFPVVLFDFRGHGRSGGTTTIGPREVLDARSVVGYVSKLFPGSRIVLVGFSMGASVAIVEASSDPRVYAVVADSPYYTLARVVPRWISYATPLPSWIGSLAGLYGSLMAGVSLDFGPANVKALDKPLLVFHSSRDPLLTRSEAEAIAAKSSCGRVVEVEGAGHVEAVDKLGPARYVDAILAAITACSKTLG